MDQKLMNFIIVFQSESLRHVTMEKTADLSDVQIKVQSH